jgi:hypothetical protein
LARIRAKIKGFKVVRDWEISSSEKATAPDHSTPDDPTTAIQQSPMERLNLLQPL